MKIVSFNSNCDWQKIGIQHILAISYEIRKCAIFAAWYDRCVSLFPLSTVAANIWEEKGFHFVKSFHSMDHENAYLYVHLNIIYLNKCLTVAVGLWNRLHSHYRITASHRTVHDFKLSRIIRVLFCFVFIAFKDQTIIDIFLITF